MNRESKLKAVVSNMKKARKKAARIILDLIVDSLDDQTWKDEFHGVCPQCAEMFILRRPSSLGVTIIGHTIQCTNCTAYFDSHLLKEMRAFLEEKPNG